MHIAFVTPESPYGDGAGCGIAAYLRAIIPAIVDAGHRVTVFANAKREGEFSAENGHVTVYQFRLPSLHWYTAKLPIVRTITPLPLRQVEWSVSFYRRVRHVAAKTKIDVIESTEAGSLFLSRIAPLVIRLHGSQRTFQEHSGKPLNFDVRLNDYLESCSCASAAAITAPSEFQANEVRKHRGWPRDRVLVIPNPISQTLLNAASEFRRNGSTERLVLYTGRLAPVKGIETLLETAKHVYSNDRSISFVLAGPWQMPQPPEHYGLQNDRASRIQWVGPQTQSEIIQWYKRASVFVMPSNYESFGISAVEAIAFGLPVVAMNAGGLREVLGDESASFVAKHDSKALAQEILKLMSAVNVNGATRETPARILQKCDPQQVSAEMLKLYEAVRSGN